MALEVGRSGGRLDDLCDRPIRDGLPPQVPPTVDPDKGCTGEVGARPADRSPGRETPEPGLSRLTGRPRRGSPAADSPLVRRRVCDGPSIP